MASRSVLVPVIMMALALAPHMAVWPQVTGGSWPPIKPMPDSPHQAADPNWNATLKPVEDEAKTRRRKLSQGT